MILTLQPGVGATLPAQLLSLKLQVLGGAQRPGVAGALPELEAVVLNTDGTERAVPDVIRHHGTLVLAVREPTLIRIRPAGTQRTFPDGSVFGLVVGPEAADSDRATLRSVDASGLRSCSLVTLAPAGAEVVVTAVAQAAQIVLPPMADRARVAAREVVGAPTVPPTAAAAVRVVIDSSASLRPVLTTGALAAAIELVSGVATVISSASSLPVTACGRNQVALADHRFEQPATATVHELAEIPPSIGFRSALVPDGGGHGLTYVITDGRPADLGTPRRDLVHLVVLGAVAGDEELAKDVAGGDDSVPVTVIDPEIGSGLPSADQLREIVRSLLAGYERRFPGARGALP